MIKPFSKYQFLQAECDKPGFEDEHRHRLWISTNHQQFLDQNQSCFAMYTPNLVMQLHDTDDL